MLRVTLLFASRIQASVHLLKGCTCYPSEMSSTLIHLTPDQFHDAEIGYPGDGSVDLEPCDDRQSTFGFPAGTNIDR